MYREQALEVYRELGHRRAETQTLWGLALAYMCNSKYGVSRACLDESLRIAREIGERHDEGWSLMMHGYLSNGLGNYHQATRYHEEALHVLYEVVSRRGEAQAQVALSVDALRLGKYDTAQRHAELGLQIGQDIGARLVQAHALTYLAHTYASRGHIAAASGAYEQAITLCRELQVLKDIGEPLAGAARIFLAEGDLHRAQAYVEEILSSMSSVQHLTPLEWSLVYLTCYRVLKASGDPRADDILQEAHTMLQEQAATLIDEGERQSLLENVEANREIVEEYALRRRDMTPNLGD